MALLLLIPWPAGCGLPSATGPPGSAAPGPGSAVQSAPKRVDIILATTTSTQDSGLLDVLIPAFERRSGHKVKTIAVGTGQALAMGDKGEADVLLVHAPADEQKLVEKGTATGRKLIMHNDFILVGPQADPAKVRGTRTASDALRNIAAAESVFLSRGDDSGTHRQELSLWQLAGIKPVGRWYQESGSGMGQTLNISNEKDGYTLADRATYLANRKNLSLEIVLEGDAKLLNLYHVMLVNPARFSKVNADGAMAFADFLLSAEGQNAIGTFGVDKYGQSLFVAAGGMTEAQLTGQR